MSLGIIHCVPVVHIHFHDFKDFLCLQSQAIVINVFCLSIEDLDYKITNIFFTVVCAFWRQYVQTILMLFEFIPEQVAAVVSHFFYCLAT